MTTAFFSLRRSLWASESHPLNGLRPLGCKSNFTRNEPELCEDRISLGQTRREVYIHDVIVSVCLEFLRGQRDIHDMRF